MRMRRPLAPTISEEQAGALARAAVQHKAHLESILGIRPDDAPMPLSGVALNATDRQMVVEALRAILPAPHEQADVKTPSTTVVGVAS